MRRALTFLGRLLIALFEEHKLVRRLVLTWACVLITIVVLRVTTPEVLPLVTTPVASIVIGVIGMLATVIAFYQHNRAQETTLDARLAAERTDGDEGPREAAGDPRDRWSRGGGPLEGRRRDLRSGQD